VVADGKRVCRYPGCTNRVGPRKHFCAYCLPLHKKEQQQRYYEGRRPTHNVEHWQRELQQRRNGQKEILRIRQETASIHSYQLQRMPAEQFAKIVNKIIQGRMVLVTSRSRRT